MRKMLLVWVVLSAIWGSTWIFIKYGLRDLPPLTFAGLRFLVAAAALLVVLVVRRPPLPRNRRQLVDIGWTSLIGISMNYGLIFWGEQRITSGLASVLQANIPVFGLLLAHYVLPTERLTWRKLAGVGLGVIGIVTIFRDQMTFGGSGAVDGSLALLLSALCVAIGNVGIKARLRGMDPAVLAAGQMLCGFPPLLLLGWWREGSLLSLRWSAGSLIALAYLALVGSALAFLLYYWLVARMEVTKTLLISLVTPVIALLIGSLVADERVTTAIMIGTVSILGGIALIFLPGAGAAARKRGA